MARPWSARCYGVARPREGSRQNSIGGSGVLSLRHFGLVLFIPWRVGAEESAAAKDANYGLWFRPARCCSTGSGRLGFRFIDFGAPRSPLSSPSRRARALMARPWSARCYGVARPREGSRQNSIGGSGVLSLRHFGLVLFIPWRVGAEESAAAKDANYGLWFRPARCCSTGSGRLDLDLLISGPRVHPFHHPLGARER